MRFRTAACVLPAIVVIGFARLLPTTANAQIATTQGSTTDLSAGLAAIEKAVDAKRQELHVPGAALVIVKDDQVIYKHGLGLRDVEHKLPVTPDTLFAIGSSSKAFTAMTAMMSVDEGKLNLADPPRKYLPYFKLQDPDANLKITVSDLLCHRSGLDRTDLIWTSGTLNSGELIRALAFVKPTAKLGEKFQYQNLMFLTAGEIVSKVQRAPWTTVVSRRIFQPLGMRSTNTSIQVMQKAPDYALGYNYDPDKKEMIHLPMRDIKFVAPAGAINSNATDMARWIQFMLDGGTVAGKRLVSEKSFQELTVPRITVAGSMKYGYGWFLRDWHGHRVVEHGGNIDGFNAEVAMMPDQHLGFVLLTNVTASPLGETAQEAVWTHLVGVPTDAAGPAITPERAVGLYHSEELKLDLEIDNKDGKLVGKGLGDAKGIALASVGGGRYKPGPPLPDGVFLLFRPSKANPTETEMVLEQSGVQIVFKRAKASDLAKPTETAKSQDPTSTPSLPSVDSVMEKAIGALGGEANLRRHTSMVVETTLDKPTQGVNGKGITYARTPNSQATQVTFYALNKKLLSTRDYFNGSSGGDESTFSPASTKAGKGLMAAKRAADFYRVLDWKTLYKTVVLKRIEKVGNEEAYVIEMTPQDGDPVTEYISTKTYLLLKRDTIVNIPSIGPLPTSETFDDWRPVDGVMVSFKGLTTLPIGGDTTTMVTKIRFNVPIPDSTFEPTPKK